MFLLKFYHIACNSNFKFQEGDSHIKRMEVLVRQGGHSAEQNKIPDFSLAVMQFSLTMQDGCSDRESTRMRMAQRSFKTKLPCLYENIKIP